ncbi:lipoprotein LpqF [Mycobacteroides abscessus subsp. abscessus]|nr:lipoprotein LpqF [Mycobacteroides abscessus subsp. abscessus]SKV47126.1 lipoprotein LpqF [Mycobacteroides abscessus subsp. abscessus]
MHAALQKVAVGPAAPVRDILAAEPGIDLHSENWRYIGAKGGNLPGDLTFSWYAEDRNRQPYVVSFQLNWDRAFGPGAAGWVIGLAKGVFKKLG